MPGAGFEPAAFWSRTKRATKLRYAPNGANEEIRTLDLRITSALLCQLSYISVWGFRPHKLPFGRKRSNVFIWHGREDSNPELRFWRPPFSRLN